MHIYFEIEDTDEFKTLTKNSKICVVDFYATWCGPCKKMAPLLEAEILNDPTLLKILSTNIKDLDNKLTLVKVDVDKFDNLTQDYKVDCMPTIIFFKDGKLTRERVEGASLKDIMKVIRKLATEQSTTSNTNAKK